MFDQKAVFPQQGNQIGNRAQAGQIQVVLPGRPARRRSFPEQCLDQLQGHPCSGQFFKRVRAIRPLRVDDGQRGRQPGRHLVVIGDDEIGAPVVFCPGDHLGPADPAIDGDDQGKALRVRPFHRLQMQAVPFVQPVGDVKIHCCPQLGEGLNQQHRAGNAVRIVIPVNQNFFPALNGQQNALHRPVHVLEKKGIRKAGQIAVKKLGRFG